ncbi:2,3,4,5-tetrahydropyridine-2,6-dicarboxylate N-succinyltransferase [Candidatus Vidania fulgoroideorum]
MFEKKINKIWKKNNFRESDFIIVEKVIKLLDKGKLVICKKKNGKWIVKKWLKKSILLYFKKKKNILKKNKIDIFFDKFDNKFIKKDKNFFIKKNIRFTQMSYVRYGSYVSKNSVLMPCFVNVGAYIGKNTMIDSWATVGSCARIGNNVHISGGAGIGGVLEPLNKTPVIIEDNCFIGARSEIVEGVIIKKNSVISMGVHIGMSTKIYDRYNKKFYKGYVPKNSVVVPGSINHGEYSLYCPIIVKKRNEVTNNKVKLNSILR